MHYFSKNAEFQQKLLIYKELLLKWSSSLNLVSKSTLADIERRHFEDSLQIAPLLSSTDKIVDIGTGAGFPGMVLALCGFDVTLIESDQKKCVFLENVSRETNSKVNVICTRIENFQPTEHERFDVICSRGLAPLSVLIQISQHLIKKNHSKGIFLKGVSVDEEISILPAEFISRIQRLSSSTNSNSSIIQYQF